VLFVALIFGLHHFTRPKEAEEDFSPSSYNADPSGTKAFYTLLGERLGYKADRLTAPYDRLPANARVLIAIEPDWETDRSLGPEMERNERLAVASWVRKGGTLIVASSRLEDLPRELRRTGPLGSGRVHVFPSPKRLTNKGMRDPRNAVDMAALVSRHASKQDLVLFDEYHHGYAESKPVMAMISRPVRMSLIVFVIAGLLAAYSRGRRFGAVRSEPEAESIRPGSEFVEAMGRLYRRAGATDVAMEIMRDSFLPRLHRKLGVTADSSPDHVAARANAVCGEDCAAAVTRLLNARPAGHKPSEQELLHAARDIQKLEKELGLEPERN
jgi:hypothetical protein